jgi:1-acyl-sn-glycerol-3-phosphate acyltransferase/transcription elongation factor Elf1
MSKKATKVKKIKKANNFLFWLLRVLFRPVLWLKYRFRFLHKTSKGIKRPCLILTNHQTTIDQFGSGSGFKFGVNIVGSDSIFRHGFLSRMMEAIARPIPYSKGSTDSSAVRHIFSIIKQGGAVLMSPSGNRSFFGEECTIKPGTGKLAQKLGVPLVLVQFRGGYNTKPRWMPKSNKGKMTAQVTRIVYPEELAAMTVDEVDELIKNELYFNEFEWNRREQIVYKGKRKAEHLETVVFHCPECHSLTDLSSEKNEFFCKKCGMRVKINEFGFFEKVANAKNCPDTILELGKIQLDYIKAFDYSPYTDKPLFSDDNVKLSYAVKSKRDEKLGIGSIALYADRIVVCDRVFMAAQIKDMSIQSFARLTIYTDEGAYVADLPKRGNAFKYMVCGYQLKYNALGITDGNYGY